MSNSNTLQKQITKSTNDALKQLEVIRKAVDEQIDEIKWLQAAPLPLEDALINVVEFIKKSASADGIKQFFFDHEIYDKVLTAPASRQVHAPLRVVDNIVAGFPELQANLAGLLCGLFPTQVETALKNQVIGAAAGVESGPPRAERPQLITEAKARLLALESEEEAVIDSAERAGLSGFYRRQDVNPEIVLMKEAA